MSRLTVTPPDCAQATMDQLCTDLERRVASAPQGSCPVELASAFLKLCLAQSCGKCVPCRIGLEQLAALMDKAIDGKAVPHDLEVIELTAESIAYSSDCAIGFEAGKMILRGMEGLKADYLSHVNSGRCLASFKAVPCVERCPASVDVPAYIALVKEGRYADAVRVIRKDNPFPSVCSLVCEHPCESHCRRAVVDDAVNIRGIKRYAVDHAGEVPAPKCAPSTGKRVAIVGGGPAGLTCAYYLSLMGHAVTVYEKHPRLGGMLRYGIPVYRLNDDYLDRDINVILSTGITVHTDIDVGKEICIDELRKEYDSVYLAIGANTDKKLGIKGENSKGVISAVELLREIGNGNKPDFTGKNVVVVGGGNVAMDVTRTSMRVGAKSVRCVYRRRVNDMTALPDEIKGAMAEGCEIVPLKAPVRIEADENGHVKALVVQPQVIGAYASGRPAPYNADKPEEHIKCDVIIVAIGQAIDSKAFAEGGIPTTKRDMFITEPGGAVKGVDGVFAGGECVTGPATVIRAIEAGKVAAANIDEYLGFHTEISCDVKVPEASYRLRPAYGRINMTERDAEERKNDFELMENGMTEQECKQECSKCLRCDHYGFGAFRGGRAFKW